MIIHHNLASLAAYNAGSQLHRTLDKAIRRLSTGLRINTAADDAAGFAVSEKMKAQTRGLEQAARNTQDGISMIQTAEGALNESSNILQRMRELSVQAANDSLTAQDRRYVQLEIDQLKEEVDRISRTTQFNKKKLLDGSADALWSADRLSTAATVRGNIEREGNYKITVNVLDTGRGEVQKSNILEEKYELFLDTFNHSAESKIITRQVPVGALDTTSVSLGFPWVSYGFTGTVTGTVTVNTKTFTFTNAAATAAFTEIQNYANTAGNGLVRVTDGFYAVLDDTQPVADQLPGAPIDISWNLSSGSMNLKYASTSITVPGSGGGTGAVTVSAGAADAVGVSWDLGKTDNNMLAGDYWLDLCPEKALGNAVGTVVETKNPFLFTAASIGTNLTENVNMSIVFEVTDIHKHEGYNAVAFSYYYVQMDADGNVRAPKSGSVVVDLNDIESGLTGIDFNGVSFWSLDISRDIEEYTIGDKFSLSTSAIPTDQVALSSHKNQSSYFLNYSFNSTRLDGTPLDLVFYQIDENTGDIVLSNLQVEIKGFISHYHDTSRDAPYAAFFTVTDTKTTRDADFNEGKIKCELERRYQGDFFAAAADSESSLRGLLKFYDGNGRFLLDQPETISFSQNGRTSSITISAYDTLSDVVRRLNALLPSSGHNAYNAVTYTSPDKRDTLARAFATNGAMNIDDSYIVALLGGDSRGASALKLMNAPLTHHGLSKMRGINPTYLAAFSLVMKEPGISDATLEQRTGVAAADISRLRLIATQMSYTNDDISFLTGLSLAEIDTLAQFWASRPNGGKGQGVASVNGTMVVRSSVPGEAGRIAFSGDEELLKALGFNTIREARETTFAVSVVDAHSGLSVGDATKITGNKMVGVVDKNIDVTFDPLAGMDVFWNALTQDFDYRVDNTPYKTYLHLVDNATILQVGANEKEELTVAFADVGAFALGITHVDVTSRERAARSVTLIDQALDRVSSLRAKLGAVQNRLESTASNLASYGVNLKESESRIRDADMAKEMLSFTALNILSQSSLSMLAQANQLPSAVMSIMR